MDFETAGAIGEALGGLAIVISLLYVGIELSRNNKITRATTSYMGAHLWAEMNTSMSSEGELFEILVKASQGEPLTVTEDYRRSNIMRSMLQRLDGLYFLHKAGLLETELWETRVEWTRRFLEAPHIQEWWTVEKETSNYSPSLISELEKVPSGGGPVHTWYTENT